MSRHGEFDEEGITISFLYFRRHSRRDIIKLVKELIVDNNLDFLSHCGNNTWKIDFDSAKAYFKENEEFVKTEWAWSAIVCEAEIEPWNNGSDRDDGTRLTFHFTKEDLMSTMNQKIFLSHSGKNKPIVRGVSLLLKTLGFQPWLDEDAMHAGVKLERALLDGMKQSCAAVFFVTPDFKDENYLATEVEYAIQQKREKGDRFAIITIVLKGKDGEEGVVPELLRPYVWKTPASETEMIHEIIKALPVMSSGVMWK